MEIMGLIEDPQGMTVRRILLEAGGGAVESNAVAAPEATRRPVWISPAPVAVKMRLFCLPYAGGVSENVFGRYVGIRCAVWASRAHAAQGYVSNMGLRPSAGGP